MRLLYNLLLPLVFPFFLPGLYWKLKKRPGWKSTFGERFGRFSPQRMEELRQRRGAVWLHAVSVGETMIAISLLNEYLKEHPGRKFVLSTTTTTGQQLARDKAPAGVTVIFCPIDFPWAVRRVYDLIRPSLLVILETEIWPNLLWQAADRKIPAVLINARMSDHSARGYRRFRCFFGKLLGSFAAISAQSEADAERFRSVSTADNVVVSGNMKFDQKVPADLPDAGYRNYFGDGDSVILLAASTHPGEEALIARTFIALRQEVPQLKLVLVPRHAERGAEVAALLDDLKLSYCRKSLNAQPGAPVDVLLADTTGEMLKLMNGADVVIMGKSLAGHDEGHNLIEPALLNKPVVTGAVLRNFRFILDALASENAVATVASDAELREVLLPLLRSREERERLGKLGGGIIRRHAGATRRTIALLERQLN